MISFDFPDWRLILRVTRWKVVGQAEGSAGFWLTLNAFRA